MIDRIRLVFLVAVVCFVGFLVDPMFSNSANAYHFGGNTTPEQEPDKDPDDDDEPCKKNPPCECQGDGNNSSGGSSGAPPAGSAGKPVSLWSGAESYVVTDLVVDGIYPIRLRRSYDSSATYDSQLGYSWSFNHDRRLFEYPDDSVRIRYGCGQHMRFVRTGGTYVTPLDGPQGELTENADGTFEYEYYDGSRDLFDADGRLTAEISKEGHRHEFLYDSREKLSLTGTSPFAVDPTKPMVVAYMPRVTKIQERTADGQLTGVYLELFYDDTTGRVNRIVTHEGREITYAHDQTVDGLTQGNLTQVTGLGNLFYEYKYESTHGNHLLTSIQKGQGSAPVINTYDAEGRVVQQTHGAQVLDFNYVTPKAKTQVTRKILDDQGQLVHSATTTVEFDVDGYVTKNTDPLGHELRYFYDTNKDVDRVEWWENTSGGLVLARTENYTHDAQGRLLSSAVTLDSGETVTRSWSYDAGWKASEQVESSADPGRVFRTEYTFERDADGQPLRIASVKLRNDDGTFVNTTYSYCTDTDISTAGSTCPYAGLVKAIDGPRTDVSDVTTIEYYPNTDLSGCDTAGPCHRKGQRWKTTNAFGQVTEIARYDRAGRPVQVKDSNGVVTDIAYHARGWLSSRAVRDPAGGADAITTYSYDDVGNSTRITQPDGSFVDFAYDARDRLAAVTDNLGNRIDYALDSEGSRLGEDTIDPDGALTRTLSREYDALNRLQASINAQGAATHFDYDSRGNQMARTDALGVVTQRTYDDLNRLVRTVQDVGGIAAATKYTYDAVGNLTQVIDPKSLQTIYSYDARSNLVQLDSPDTGTTTYEYDQASNRISKSDASGNIVTFKYDALNRLTETNYPESSLDVIFHYDETSTLTGCNESYPNGRLTRMEDSSGSTTYCYDYRGNLIQKVQRTDGLSLTVGYEYDLADQLLAITYPSGRRVAVARDAAGYTSSITLDGMTTIADNLQFLPFGPLKNLTFGNGESLERTYNKNYWLKSISSPALALHFSRDSVGNIRALADDADMGTLRENYFYDNLYRLIRIEDSESSLIQAFTYDNTGNRLTKATSDVTSLYTYSDQTNQLTAVDNFAREYDAVGNTISDAKQSRSYTYDNRHRLTEATTASGTGQYQYNGIGERVRKTSSELNIVSSNTSYFLYDETGRLLGEYSGGGIALREYVYAAKMPVAVLSSSGIQYVHADHLGTPRAVTDGAGVKIWGWPFQSNAFGAVPSDEDPDGDGISFVLNLRFPGQYFDQESELHYNYFRDYEPSTGRYLQTDPIGLRGGMGLYSYADNKPLTLVDPHGLRPDILLVLEALCAIFDRGLEAADSRNEARRQDCYQDWQDNRATIEEGCRISMENCLYKAEPCQDSCLDRKDKECRSLQREEWELFRNCINNVPGPGLDLECAFSRRPRKGW